MPRIDGVGYGTHAYEYENAATPQNFYASAVADIGEGATYTTDSDAIYVAGASTVCIQVLSTGANASSAGNVTFNFLGGNAARDGTPTYPTVTSFSIILPLNSNTAVIKDELVDVSGYKWLKVDSIVNGDATYHISATNANIYYKY
jgi:hypothetical protein